MSSFFEAAREFEAGKQRPKHETNVTLLRLPSSSPALVRSSNGFGHFASKERKAVMRANTTHTYSAASASVTLKNDSAASASLLPPLNTTLMSTTNSNGTVDTSVVVDKTAIPDAVAAAHEAHRMRLAASRRDLVLLEERDASDIARRAKAQRLEEERRGRVRRIAAGLQDIGTIDFDPEEGAPAASAMRRSLGGAAFHPQARDGTLTATDLTTRAGREATIADYFSTKAPTMAYATDGIYPTQLHSTVAEAAATRALEASSVGGGGGGGGASRLMEGSTATGTSSHQLRALLLQQQMAGGGGGALSSSQQAGASGGLRGLARTVGEEAAANVNGYLRGKYGPSMLWPPSGTEAEEAYYTRRGDAEGLATVAASVGGPMAVGATPTTTVLTASGPAIFCGVPRRLLGQSASQLAEALIDRRLREEAREADERRERAAARRLRAAREAAGAASELYDGLDE